MKILQAHEEGDQIEATVEFPDGFTQSVRVPIWATKQNIKDEAKRIRKQIEDRETKKVKRPDLEG